ncbi:hypothetical protein [Arenibacter sp. S6351L]|uniref:hypothetical protein n=1 Tax=Arenibacter sp. S6351L TaxID=2926407 RepID=UPI001FF5EA04|nr:hypothetical protein [Arenibacter sp. S6351L]MCK0136575.1 hypothetical protein [Arenibacter sp. S6351L]
MKTIRTLLLITIILFVASCDKDESISMDTDLTKGTSIPKGDDPATEDESLTFTVRTTEDQMGPFAKSTMVEYNGKVWSVGGINAYSTPNSSSDVWSSENGKNWISVTNDKFSEREGHTLTVYDNKMWLIGGVDDSRTHLGEIYFSTDGVNWTMVTALSPTLLAPAFHSTVVFNDKLYVIRDGFDDHVIVLSSSDGINWNLETDHAFSNREDFEAVVFENAIYVIGGKHLDTSFNEIWKSTDGIEWNLVTPNTDIFSPRYAHTATAHNNKVWVVGGVTGPYSETHIDFWYSENMEDWTEYDGPLPATEGLIHHASLSYNEELWLFGGYQPNASGTAPITGEIRSIKEEE